MIWYNLLSPTCCLACDAYVILLTPCTNHRCVGPPKALVLVLVCLSHPSPNSLHPSARHTPSQENDTPLVTINTVLFRFRFRNSPMLVPTIIASIIFLSSFTLSRTPSAPSPPVPELLCRHLSSLSLGLGLAWFLTLTLALELGLISIDGPRVR